MFLQSVSEGISSLSDWHIVVAMVGVGLSTVFFWILVGRAVGGQETESHLGRGCLFAIIGGPIVQTLNVTAFLLFCLPAILGIGGFTPYEFIALLFWPILKNGMWAMALVILLGLVPIVGRFIADTPGVPFFLQGILMLKPVMKQLHFSLTDGQRLPDSAFPSFWNSVGYVVIGLVLCYSFFMICGLISIQIKKRTDPVGLRIDMHRSEPGGAMTFIGLLIGPALGILPLLMYGHFVGIYIQAL